MGMQSLPIIRDFDLGVQACEKSGDSREVCRHAARLAYRVFRRHHQSLDAQRIGTTLRSLV